MLSNPKLGHGVCKIICIPFSFAECEYILDKSCIRELTPQQQSCHKPVMDFIYWTVLGSFNNWNITT